MQLRNLFIATTLLLAISSSCFAAGKSSGFKCWKNKQGIQECGNEVPPEYSQGETRTVNKAGITTSVEARAKTKEEAEAEARAQEEQDKEKKKAPDKEQVIKEQQARDRVLLASYLNEEDINAARNRKISALNASIQMSHTLIEKLKDKLKNEEQRAESLKKSGKEMSAEEKGDMESLRKQIDNKKTFIEFKEKEKETTNLEYDGFVKRFRELKAEKTTK